MLDLPSADQHPLSPVSPQIHAADGGTRRIALIEPVQGWARLDLLELWEYRDLLYFLIWRDVKVRYKQTVLGIAWAAIQPLLTMIVFTLFFGMLARMPSDGVPYAAFSFVALVPWTFFAYGLAQTSNSLVLNQSLITKVYFPRLAIPFASVLSGLVDFAVSFAILLGIMAWFGIAPTLRILWVPPLLVLALITALGVGLWLSALNVLYRDVRYTVPFLTQLWLFATPIAYPSSLLPEPWRTVYGLNPMAGVVEGFRWALLDMNVPPPGPIIVASAAAAAAIFVGGLFYFRRMERSFADVI